MTGGTRRICVIIPTNNRQYYLGEVIKYWENSEFDIIICDSTIHKYEEIANHNVEYVHYPEEKFPEKVYRTIIEKNVKEQYDFVVFSADDDFVYLDSIGKCVDFLINNKDYGSVRGQFLSYEYEGGSSIQLNPPYKDELDLDYGEDTAYERIKHFHSVKAEVVWGVYQADVIYNIFRDMHSANLPTYNELETHGICLFALMYGKHKICPFFYGMREASIYSVGSCAKRLVEIINSDEYTKEVENYFNAIAIGLRRIDGIEFEQAYDFVKNETNQLVKLYADINSNSKSRLLTLKKCLKNVRVFRFVKILIKHKKSKVKSLYKTFRPIAAENKILLEEVRFIEAAIVKRGKTR
ncbi:TIGR00180 family glycosyltransferase [Bacilliculturomica massiliensis]|uniref:TIGR00180 family glycosyltransferase n=1 Tax=Bacilliculturomica massiliensis TaxID=1917867 RepID=UPI001032367D|nr:TIGR00180 family glycosyltransferase [Bacilliculturomica massiliensis]